jgi:hypothetical protein
LGDGLEDGFLAFGSLGVWNHGEHGEWQGFLLHHRRQSHTGAAKALFGNSLTGAGVISQHVIRPFPPTAGAEHRFSTNSQPRRGGASAGLRHFEMHPTFLLTQLNKYFWLNFLPDDSA